MPQKQKKVKIDKDRFGKLFDKNSEFNTIGKFDKTGKRVDQKDKMMQKYYRMEKDDGDDSQDGEVSDKKAEGAGSKFYDGEGNF